MHDQTRELLKVVRHDNTLNAAERTALIALLNGRPSEPAPTERLLRRREAAARCSASLRTVDRWCAMGLLRRVKLPGFHRASGIPESAVNALIAGGIPNEGAQA